jgi:predicted Zn-dependent protease
MAQSTEHLEKAIQAAMARVAGPAAAGRGFQVAWQEARRDNADDHLAVRALVHRLRQDGHAYLIAGLTAALAEQVPDAAWAWGLAAESAVAAEDYESALDKAEELRRRFPNLDIGLRFALEALTPMGRLHEVAGLLQQLTPEQLEMEWALVPRIAVAERNGEHVKALEAGQALAKLWPRRPEGFLAEISAISRLGRHDEAERGIANLIAGFPHHAGVWQAGAQIADARGDFDAALHRWAEMRKRARTVPDGFIGALQSLKRAKRMDMATPILYEGLARFPNNETLLVIAAQTAEGATQVDDADLFWQRVLAICPDDAGYALSAALCLMCSPVGRPGRMGQVLHRLGGHHARFPHHAAAYVAHLNALREIKQPEVAIEASAGWCALFPKDVRLALARAGAFEDKGDREGALAEVAALRGRVGSNPEVEAAFVRALSIAGQYDAADRAGAAALTKFPSALRLLMEYSRISTRRGDWHEAYQRLLDARRILPNDVGIARELQNTRLQLAEALPDGHSSAVPNDAIMRFESLGGTGVSCEFGMVQRELGRDSIGLLRWSRNEASHLIDALGCEFEGVGSEESTILKTVRHAVDDEEYVTQDRRFFMESHTFVRTSDAPAEAMFKQTCRRLRFLRGKLLEDLRAGEKIFMFKAHHVLTDDQVRELHAALCRYGDNALLCVMRAGPGHAPSTVRVLGRGIYVGYVTHFLNDESGLPGFDIPGWQAICAETDADWQRVRQRPGVAAA